LTPWQLAQVIPYRFKTLINFRWYPGLGDGGSVTLGYSNGNATGTLFVAASGSTGSIKTNPTITGKTYIEIVIGAYVGDIGFGLIDISKPYSTSAFWAPTNLIFAMCGKVAGCGNSVGLYNDGTSTPNGAYAVAQNDVIGIAFDSVASKMWFRKNGTWIQGDPVAGTSPSITPPASSYRYIATWYSCNSGGNTMRYDIRVMNSEFRDAPPTGYTSYSGL
jgi:hypothetical protein